MNLPLVTIGAINYNNSPYVLETLNSIAAQTYENIELVIVDDSSTDDSLNKIKQWLANYQRPYKLIVHPLNEGVHKGYESVIQNASGEYLSLIATDDVLEPDKTEQQVLAFQKLDGSYGLVYGDVIEINDNSQVIDQSYFTRHRRNGKDWQLPQGDVFKRVAEEFLIWVQSALIKTQVLKDFSFHYKALSEDWQVILYLARRTKFFGTNNVVVRYRKHDVSVTVQNRKRERYYLWCRSDALMFYEAYGFAGNSKEEKKVIANSIQLHMSAYAKQSNAKYSDVIKTWRQVTRKLPLLKSIQLFILILWARTKLLIKKIFPNYKRHTLVLQKWNEAR